MSVVSAKILNEYDPGKPFVFRPPPFGRRKDTLIFSYKEATISHLAFNEARKLEDKDYNLIFYSELPEDKIIKFDCLTTIISPPIVNKKVLALLNEFCPNDFQALPVYVKNSPEAKKIEPFCNRDYFLINPLYMVDSIDNEKSEFKRFADPRLANEILGFKKLVFKQNVMNGHHLARERNYNCMVVVSRELALFLNQYKLKGIDFCPDYMAYGYYGF